MSDVDATYTISCTDKSNFKEHLNGPSYKNALDEIWNKIFRARIKYGDLSGSLHELVQEMADEYHEIMGEID